MLPGGGGFTQIHYTFSATQDRNHKLGAGFKYVSCFTPNPGKGSNLMVAFFPLGS